MTFKQFVYRNTMRNKPLYLAYFFSTLLSVMVFFTFSAMAFHPIVKTGASPNLLIGMLGSAVIIYLFAIFFVWYSMGIFLQSRKKEFGLFLIQGMSMKQLKRMVGIETMIIGFWSTLFGTLAGIGFSQVILAVARRSLHLPFASYFPTEAITLTIASFFVLFVLLSAITRFQLPKQTIQELLQAQDQGKGTIHFSRVKSSLAFLFLVVGYGLAIWAKGLLVLTVFLPVLFLVTVGTFFFYSQLSVRIIETIKKHPAFFWTKKNFLVFSDLAFRMKDNAKSFFLITIVSTVAFVSVGTLYGVKELFLGVFEQIPNAFSAPAEERFIQPLENELKKEKISFKKTSYSMFTIENQSFIHENEWNQLAAFYKKQGVTLKENSVIQLKQAGVNQQIKPVDQLKINGKTYSVQEVYQTNFFPVASSTFIIPNKVIVSEEEKQLDKTVVYVTDKATREQKIAVGQKVSEIPLIVSKDYMTDLVTKNYAPVLFVGIFISFVFVVSAGSFLYFRLYSDLETDSKKYAMIYRVGLSKKELKRVVLRQVRFLFFIPLGLSLVHSYVALNAMYRIFDLSIQPAAFQVLAFFILAQVIYYGIASRFYFQSICKKIGMK